MFENRQDAGQQLSKKLKQYKEDDPLVLAIPRGGVEVGYEVAQNLDMDFSILISRKLPLPYNPEGGFGAIAEDGSKYIINSYKFHLNEDKISEIVAEQKQEIARRIEILRKGRSLPKLENRTVILVDDGIATGSTMLVSTRLCKNQNAKKIIIAVPVAGNKSIEKFSKLVDDLIVLESPENFRAVAQVYENWYDVSDKEVLEILYSEK